LMAVDSNIWCYYVDPTLPEHEPVSKFMDDLILSGEGILTNTVIWMEVGHYLYKVSRLPRNAIAEILNGLMGLSTMVIVELDLELLHESLAVLSRLWTYPIGGRDATIIASMNRLGVKELVTHDEGFKALAKAGIIEVIDPVEGAFRP